MTGTPRTAALLSAVLLAGPAAGADRMKAIQHHEYGDVEVLKLEDVDKPAPAEDQVLVKVRAASVNPLDWHYMRGTPYLVRMEAGFGAPKEPRLGVDFAGVVEAVGAKVTNFKVGDEVYGGRTGALAEYVVVRAERAIVHKPSNVTFEQAAAVPIAGITALQSLRDKAGVKPGQKVLINGASGGVGTFAVQIAKWLGADVTAVCSGKNVELVRSLGADHVVDYTKDDFTKGAEHYDVVIDNVGVGHSLLAIRQVLTPNGKYVLVGGGGPDEGNWIGPFGRIIAAWALNPFVSQEMGSFLAELTPKDLGVLADLMQSGKVKPVIDREYPLAQTADAIRYLEQGHARGKVVVRIE